MQKIHELNGVVIRPVWQKKNMTQCSYSVCVRPDAAQEAVELLADSTNR
jgi:hypothetical protein